MRAQRRICWPVFDATCLEGGCSYCNTMPYRNISSIERAINKGKGIPKNRGDGSEADLGAAFVYGRQNGWTNAEARIVV